MPVFIFHAILVIFRGKNAVCPEGFPARSFSHPVDRLRAGKRAHGKKVGIMVREKCIFHETLATFVAKNPVWLQGDVAIRSALAGSIPAIGGNSLAE